MKTLKILIILALTAFAGACSKSYTGEELEVKTAVERNIDFFNAEDLQGYLSTLLPSARAESEEMISTIFELYDLDSSIKIKDIKIINNDTAEVNIIQITKKIRGGEFMDNKSSSIHILKKINGEWLFSDSQILKVDYL